MVCCLFNERAIELLTWKCVENYLEPWTLHWWEENQFSILWLNWIEASTMDEIVNWTVWNALQEQQRRPKQELRCDWGDVASFFQPMEKRARETLSTDSNSAQWKGFHVIHLLDTTSRQTFLNHGDSNLGYIDWTWIFI